MENEQADAARDCRTRLVTKFSGMYGDRKIFIFPVQLTTSRFGNLIRLIHTLLDGMTVHTYIHTFDIPPGSLSSRNCTQLKKGLIVSTITEQGDAQKV